MKMNLRHALAALVVAGFAMPSFAAMDGATQAKLKAELAGPQRSDANKARDKYRHPMETLMFFGFSQSMAVMEIWPGGGWWTEFLAPTLAAKGRYVAADTPGGEGTSELNAKLASNGALYGKAEVAVFSGKSEPAKPGSMDMVLTFRNLHNWMGAGNAKAMIDSMYTSLKPGGYLGIEEHRAPTTAPQDPKARMGYVREDYAIKLIEASGFKLVDKSEINSNPNDTKDYPKGVWTLPPTFTEGAKDHDKYAAIGESDRFTLLFQKPAS